MVFCWNKEPMLKAYVSEIERFLQEFDKKPEASSASRRAEEAKYEVIGRLRDKPEAKAKQFFAVIWEGFQYGE